jgi:hypothetical protein
MQRINKSGKNESCKIAAQFKIMTSIIIQKIEPGEKNRVWEGALTALGTSTKSAQICCRG